MTGHQAPAALRAGEPSSAAGLTVHDAVASLAADGEYQKAADLWSGHLAWLDEHADPRTIATCTAHYVWDGKMRRLGVERAVDDLVDAFADAGDFR